jgi:hypothetical protein
MSVRRIGFALLLGVFACELALLWCALFVNRYFLVPAIVMFLLGGGASVRLRCPKCRSSVFKHRVGGMEVWAPWVSRKCEVCGSPLDAKVARVDADLNRGRG